MGCNKDNSSRLVKQVRFSIAHLLVHDLKARGEHGGRVVDEQLQLLLL